MSMVDDMEARSPVLTTKDIILEMRGKLDKVGSDVSGVLIEQARVAAHLAAESNSSSERRSRMLEVQSGLITRLNEQRTDINILKEFKGEAVGAIKLAKWAMGASLLASLLLVVQFAMGLAGHPL